MEEARSRARRQRSVSPTQDRTPTKQTKTPRGYLSNFYLPTMFQIKVRDRSDVSAKKKFQVNLPSRLLVILGLVFLVIPIMIFFQKEAHIHENHDEAHYKPRKFVNVDSKQAMLHFLDNQKNNNNTASSNDEIKEKAPLRDEAVIEGLLKENEPSIQSLSYNTTGFLHNSTIADGRRQLRQNTYRRRR